MSAIFRASPVSLSLFISNIQVQAPTPSALAMQSSFPISSQGNLKDSSIFFRSYPFSPSGKPAWVETGNKNNIKKEATYRINFCREETKKAIPKLIKKLPEGVVLNEERIENLTSVFPLQYLSMFEQFSKSKKWNFYYWLLYSNVLKRVLFSHHLIRILVLFMMLKR